MVTKDKHYYYKGTEYVVVGFSMMKTSTGNGTESWKEAVLYKRASELNDDNALVFTRRKDDFEIKFIPTLLEVDDCIIAVSMGKIAAEYIVKEVDENQAVAISHNGTTLIVNKEIDSEGICTRISGGTSFSSDYYYHKFGDITFRIANEEVLNSICDSLSQAITRIQNIDLQNTTFSLQEAKNSIEQTLKIVYKKFGV